MAYKIHNKFNGNDFTYPTYGMWQTNDLEEARYRRDTIRGYMKFVGLADLAENVIIVDTSSSEEFD